MTTTLWADEPSPSADARLAFAPAIEAAWDGLLSIAAGGMARDLVIDDSAAGDSLASFWNRYLPIATGRDQPGFVVGQLGQSLDGRIATVTGRSHYINGPEAIDHLHRLRALVDAVIVGVGTVLADDPLLTVRRVRGASPARVVIDPNGRLTGDARLLSSDAPPVFAIQSQDQPRPRGVTPITIPGRDGGGIAPADVIAALALRGYRRILVEGGAKTLSRFLAAGAINRLHVCVAPMMIGSGPIGITLPPIDHLDAAMRPRTAIHQLGRDILFDCELERETA